MDFAPSERLLRLPPYLFAEMERKRKRLEEEGRDIINLGIGDPDQPPPELALRELAAHLHDPGIHMYSTSHGTDEYRAAVASWMKARYGVALDPRSEVLMGIGSKEMIAHLPGALTNPGDVVLVPEPGYPPYRSGAIFASCEPYTIPLRAEAGFLPDLDVIPPAVAKRAKILYVNYPNNPTGAVATPEFYARVVAFARAHGLLVVSDAAYAELYYGDDRPVSFLQTSGARDVGIEVHSMTKTFNMAGWRMAWACGHPRVLETLRSYKANGDSGQFMALQKAVAAVLTRGHDEMRGIRAMYERRRDILVNGLRRIGWNIPLPRATFYVWFRVPEAGMTSAAWAEKALDRANIVVTPGIGFGAAGEGFVRIALTVTEERLAESVERFGKM